MKGLDCATVLPHTTDAQPGKLCKLNAVPSPCSDLTEYLECLVIKKNETGYAPQMPNAETYKKQCDVEEPILARTRRSNSKSPTRLCSELQLLSDIVIDELKDVRITAIISFFFNDKFGVITFQQFNVLALEISLNGLNKLAFIGVLEIHKLLEI
ncbi:hypothetical protein DdX_21758 [Ditylenchus destructor]|uniref:Uncharacterized protein n=1 Tax=Ditylenchus destructor TaxID=166010 RepID=A0AAD4MEG0_9BILA|nr:hypothetical protein DdX_21758 [Ditylenchus destructor]